MYGQDCQWDQTTGLLVCQPFAGALGSQEPPAPGLTCQPATGAAALVPNAITLGGYAATLWWLAGGSPVYAVAGLVADEVDGRVARAMCAQSELGSNLDWAVDLTVTGLVAYRLGILWALVPITLAQAYLRTDGWRPTIGSARAVLTIAAILLGK